MKLFFLDWQRRDRLTLTIEDRAIKTTLPTYAYIGLVATAIPIAINPSPAIAYNPQHLQQLQRTRQCVACDLSGANLAVLRLNLTSANLAKANLKNAILSDLNLTGINLAGADLTGAKAERVRLVGANLVRAQLDGIDLSNTDLAYSNLAGASLRSVILNNGDLTGANLAGANLTNTNLRDTNLTGANLFGAIGLGGVDIQPRNRTDEGGPSPMPSVNSPSPAATPRSLPLPSQPSRRRVGRPTRTQPGGARLLDRPVDLDGL
jgi:uncharacterized protein YjbI with pentapeptide repeats